MTDRDTSRRFEPTPATIAGSAVAALLMVACATTAPPAQEPTAVEPQTHEIVQVAEVDAPVDVVWDSWTTASGLQTFFAPAAEIEATVPGTFAVRRAEGDAVALLAGAVVGLEPESSMTLEPGPSSEVAVRFTSLADGRTRVTIVQRSEGPPGAQDPGAAMPPDAWAATFGRMERRFAEGPIDWSAEARPVVSAAR